MIEKWLPVVGWEGLYEVSSHGRVCSLERTVSFPDGRRSYTRPSRMLGWKSHRGYSRVVLSAPGRVKRDVFVHDLMLEAFVGPAAPGQVARHIDDDKQHNLISNLQWGTYSENMDDRVRNGIHHAANQTHCRNNHQFDEENTIRRRNGGRACRTCVRRSAREYARKKRLERSK